MRLSRYAKLGFPGTLYSGGYVAAVIDKNWKLQRYDRKDYSDVVEFPVEIVGRDGVVRRYTFEDSIRLYQRRITFAPVRYRDVDLVQAEVNHCQSRIDQLRTSFFHRFGWGTPQGQPHAHAVFGALAGEVAAFICRVLRCVGRPEIQFERVAEEVDGVSTWYVTPEGAKSGMILYVHRFDDGDSDAVRDTFFASLKSMERMGRMAGDGERLLAFHHTVDCGFVLSGRGDEFSSLASGDDESEPSIDLTPTPWDEVLEVIRRGEYDAALRRCQTMLNDQPWHRKAYMAGAMLACFQGQYAVAEDLSLLGSRYFPEDGILSYYLGLARLQQARPAEAEVSLREAVQRCPDLLHARSLLVVMLVRGQRFHAALQVLMEPRDTPPEDRGAEAELQRLALWIRWRAAVLGAGALLTAMGPIVAVFLGLGGLLVSALGLGLLAIGWLAFRRYIDVILSRQRFEEVSVGLKRLQKRSSMGAVVS
jgi:hypothetical protein